MQTYWLSCRKNTNNISSKQVIMTTKIVREKSIYSNSMIDKSRFLIHKHEKN